jgi:YggT family protein
LTLICNLLSLYLLVLVVRAILSWFPLSPGSALAPLASFLYAVTEPVLAPLRRVIPPLGGFDISFIVLFFAIQIIQRSVLRCTGGFL